METYNKEKSFFGNILLIFLVPNSTNPLNISVAQKLFEFTTVKHKILYVKSQQVIFVKGICHEVTYKFLGQNFAVQVITPTISGEHCKSTSFFSFKFASFFIEV